MNTRTRSFWNDILTPETLEQINTENRMAIRLLARAGIPLSIANYFAQTVLSTKGLLSLRSYWLLIYFASLFLLERYVIPQRCRHTTVLLYCIEAPVMVVTILLGTVWDPDHQALTFLMFLMAMPVFILDRPLRLLSVFTGWTAAFLVLCKLVKDPSTNRGDFFHAAEFYLATAAVTYVVLRVRLMSLKYLERTLYHLEHDELTGCRNRRSLLTRTDLYVGRSLLVLTADLDRLDVYNDFYGRDVGDEILMTFTDAVVRQFGEEDCYRVAGSQMLCILPGMPLQECLRRIDACRQSLRRRTFEDRTITLDVAFGYVTGTAEDATVLSDMTQLSGIYVRKAKLLGQAETEGGPFSPQALRDAIEESNVDAAARVYETNQLTGLPSMSFFISSSDGLLQSVVQLERSPMIGYFNLLNFRSFNDAYGYKEGDNLIRFLAATLQTAFPNRSICSISGSTFGLMIYREEIDKGLETVQEALAEYKSGVTLEFKAGFALYTGESSTISLLDRAKIAHNSIRSSSETYRIYDESLDKELRFRQYLINHVDQAVEENWLKVYYQPIVRSVNGKICNEEALSRWVDPTYGFLPPYRFIPVLEENRLIYKVSLHVVRTVLADFRRKEAAGIPLVPVSVNLSRHDFEQCDMVEEIARLVGESGFTPGLLKIEITESAFTENPEMLKREVDRFHSKGFDVWMDDFGSEYSTLNLLQDLSFDLIKIDMQFMKNYTACGRNSIIVSDIVDMAHQLGITTLIEGIETDEHFRLLRDLGCEKLQGFLFDRPSPLEHVLECSERDGASWFETWDENDYYGEVGRIDLIHPFSGTGRKGLPTPFSAETPAGVLEVRPEGMICLRGGGAFLRHLESLGLLSAQEAEQRMPRLTLPLPEALVSAVERCGREKDWISLHLEDRDGVTQTCYMIQVAEHKEREAAAVLAVFLPYHQRNH